MITRALHGFVLGGKHIASFYIDPYLRPSQKFSGTWMEAGRGQWNFNIRAGHLLYVICYYRYDKYVVASFYVVLVVNFVIYGFWWSSFVFVKVATALLVMTTCFKQWASYETVPVHGSEWKMQCTKFYEGIQFYNLQKQSFLMLKLLKFSCCLQVEKAAKSNSIWKYTNH